MPYLGNNLQVAFESYQNIDDISSSFDGSTTSFALQVGGVAPSPFPKLEQNVLISVGGVIQKPDSGGTTGFKFTGTNIVFSSAPATGESFFGVVLAGADYVNAGTNFPVGTAGAPSITFKDDEDTGLYHPSANAVSVTTGGTQRATFDSNGRLGIGTDSPARALTIYGDTGLSLQNSTTGTGTGNGSHIWANGDDLLLQNREAAAIKFYTSDSERIRLDDVGMTGVRTTVPRATLHVKAHDDNWEAGLLLDDTTGDDCWNIHPNSSDASLLIGYNDDTTAALTSQSALQVVKIHSNGDIDVPTGSIKLTEAGQGINFHPSSGTSNLLDEYEEGTWTPAFSAASTTNFTYSSNRGGSYVRIGRFVWCHGRIELSNNSGSGNLSLTGLPFTCGDIQSGDSGWEGDISTGYINDAQSATSGPMGVVNEGGTTAVLYHALSSGNGSPWQASEMDNTVSWSFSVMYPVA